MTTDWRDKPYYSLDAYCKNTFHQKCYKISLNANMTCPNRDGSLDTRGCIFCSAGGSGEFAVSQQKYSMDEQIAQGLAMFGNKQVGQAFIAYFQAYTNTYGPLDYLQRIFTQALQHQSICGISIATRPDCLGPDVLDLLSLLQKQFPEKFIWIELGLQTIHETTASYIRRGYKLPIFHQCALQLKERSIPLIVHCILGLPGETISMQLETISYLNTIKPFGIKLQLLHILKDTDLYTDYLAGQVPTYTLDGYIQTVIACLEQLSPEIVVHRVTGDGPRELLAAPLWSLNKRNVLNTLHSRMKEQNSYQGKLFRTL